MDTVTRLLLVTMKDQAPTKTLSQAGTIADITENDCALFQNAVELAGAKWNGAILLNIGLGASRFSELLKAVDGISSRLLSSRLQLLETHGLVIREVAASHPVLVTYTLTQPGTELIKVLAPLVPWGARWGIETKRHDQ